MRLRLAAVLVVVPVGLLGFFIALPDELASSDASLGLFRAEVIAAPFLGLVSATAAAIAAAFSYRDHGRLRPSLLMAAALLEILFMGSLLIATAAALRGF